MAKIKDFLNSTKEKRNSELEELKARLEALEAKNNESEDEAELKATGEEIDALKAKKAELEAELADIDAQLAELDQPKEGESTEGRRIMNHMKKEERKNMNIEERKAKAEEFAKRGVMNIGASETRAMLVSSGTIVTPAGVNETINEFDKTVSSFIDMVNVQNCAGMGTNTIPYEFSAPEGGITVEGETYAEGDTVTDFVTTSPKKVTTISYISEETRKLTPIAYEALVRKNALYALRKKANSIIMSNLKASELNKTDVHFDGINEKTLRKLAFYYGGREDVKGGAVLAINKATLVKFGDVRGEKEKKAVYDIAFDGDSATTGTIKDGGLTVSFVINENLADNELVYGQAKNFELDLYSDYEVKVSEDFKFDKGLLAVRGSVMLDGTVTCKDGFIVALASVSS